MVLGMAKIKRDKALCSKCLRCDRILYGFSNMECVRIHDEDIKKEDVQLALDRMILVCETACITVEV